MYILIFCSQQRHIRNTFLWLFSHDAYAKSGLQGRLIKTREYLSGIGCLAHISYHIAVKKI